MATDTTARPAVWVTEALMVPRQYGRDRNVCKRRPARRWDRYTPYDMGASASADDSVIWQARRWPPPSPMTQRQIVAKFLAACRRMNTGGR